MSGFNVPNKVHLFYILFHYKDESRLITISEDNGALTYSQAIHEYSVDAHACPELSNSERHPIHQISKSRRVNALSYHMMGDISKSAYSRLKKK